MKLSLFIIIVSFLAGCVNSSTAKANAAQKNYQTEIKLAKKYEDPISPMNQLDKYDQIVLMVENKQIEEIAYSCSVFRDRPCPNLKAKRNSNGYFVLKITHPAVGVHLDAIGFKSIYLYYGYDKDNKQKFSGVLKVNFKPIKK